MASSRSKAGAVMENSRQGLLDRYTFNHLLTCTCPQVFNCRCDMDCKPSIVFLSFYRVPRSNMLLNLHVFSELISVLCAISFGFDTSFIWHKWFAYIDSSSIHVHELSFKKAEYYESSCTECVCVPLYINWAIMIILYYFVLTFFTADHSVSCSCTIFRS